MIKVLVPCAAMVLVLAALPSCAAWQHAQRRLAREASVAEAAAAAPEQGSEALLYGAVFRRYGPGLRPLGGARVSIGSPKADPSDPLLRPIESARTGPDGRFSLRTPRGWEGRDMRLRFEGPAHGPFELLLSMPSDRQGRAISVVLEPVPPGAELDLPAVGGWVLPPDSPFEIIDGE